MKRISDKYRTGLVCSVLIIITFAVFWQAHSFEFINFDDNRYITENPNITNGLTFENYCEAFTAPHYFMWHPMTSLSHLLDYQFFGLNAGEHHLVNLFFHIANTLLLFTVLRMMTGVYWPSAFVAALFAVHPLNVESVAWVSERKTVLSAFFSFLTIAAYIHYIKCPHQMLNYLLVIFVFALAVMSKPTTVTLPFVLLLLDYWPLERIRGQKTGDRRQRTEDASQKLSVWQLIKEKIPLLVLSVVLCVLTVIAQKSGKVLGLNEYLPFHVRLENALVSYVIYIGKMFYPASLAIFYPHPGFSISLWLAIASFFLLVIVSIAVIYLGRHKAYLVVGWLWFLGTLVPMIGLVQAGAQAMADRYAYISLIGLFIMVAWGMPDLLSKYQFHRIVLSILSVAVISVLSVCAFFQVGHWRNSQTLYEHAIKVTRGNYLAYNGLGLVLAEQNKFDEAVTLLDMSVHIKPSYAEAYNNLGFVYDKLGRLPDAAEAYKLAVKVKPGLVEAYYNLGLVCDKLGRLADAIEAYSNAIKINPDFVEAYNGFGVDLGILGQFEGAIVAFNEVIRIDPVNIEAYNNLGTTYNRLGRLQDAVQVFEQAIKIKPEDTRGYYGLGLVYIKADDINSAKKQYEILKTLDPEQAEKLAACVANFSGAKNR